MEGEPPGFKFAAASAAARAFFGGAGILAVGRGETTLSLDSQTSQSAPTPTLSEAPM